MSLQEKTKQIKSYSKAIKTNFLEIGKILIEVRDKELWKEGYRSLTEYLDSENFEFTRRMAYHLIDIYKEFGGNEEKISGLGIGKLVELTYVKDNEYREELIEKAKTLTGKELREEIKKTREDELYSEIDRKAKRENENVFTESDEPVIKCKRQGQSILNDINRLKYPISNMRLRLEKWVKFSSKFKEDKDIDKLKAAIFLEWKKLLGL